MAISFDNAFGAQETALRLRAQRASVISSNLANANTPGYKARDIDFKEAFAQQRSGRVDGMKTTHAGHLGGNEKSGVTNDFFYRIPLQPSIDGNTVEENIEHAEFMKNSNEFQAAFTFLNSAVKGMRKAIKGQ